MEAFGSDSELKLVGEMVDRVEDSVDSEEPVDSAKEWKTTREFGVRNDEESFFVSDEIELSRSGMNSQLPPLDAAMEKGLVVARESVLQPPSLKPVADEVVVSSEDASTDLRGPSCSRENVTSLHDLQEEDQDMGVPYVDDVESTMAMIKAGTAVEVVSPLSASRISSKVESLCRKLMELKENRCMALSPRLLPCCTQAACVADEASVACEPAAQDFHGAAELPCCPQGPSVGWVDG